MPTWIVDPWYRFWCDCVLAVHRRKVQYSGFHRGLFGLCEWKILRSRATQCTDCAAGTFNEASGQPYCVSCAAKASENGVDHPYWSRSGADSCATCIRGWYRNENYDKSHYKGNEKKSAPCFSCPDGTDCTAYNQDIEDLPIKSNYFRFTSTSHFVYACPYDDACLGSNATETANGTFGNVLCHFSSPKYSCISSVTALHGGASPPLLLIIDRGLCTDL